jgi:UPF0716 protein FxsA
MILFFVFVIAPIIELFVLIKTGQAIGALNTIGLLILVALVGSALVKREGIKVWNRFVTQVQAGQAPTREIADGVCLLLAGALLIAPGFVSDVLALLLLFPPTRAVFRRFLMRRQSLGGFGRTRVIKATYGGRMTDTSRPDSTITDVTSTETHGKLDP